ncbi:DHA2 family efflux MFS transporter permease subunit [Actinoplanes sp. NPDC051343]|uniref:DHA2 family efflux MFS transporter permease subunit n=1 Tax=Actinoplanes sp. NPDC051343 TaxID=3363906 RepID=UPI00378AEC24
MTERREPSLLVLALVLVLGLVAPLLDSTIVNVAIPTLRHDLGASVATIQWVSTAYLLAVALAIPVTGWASQRYGPRRIWLIALALFLAGSVLSGLAWNIESLIAFRALQGAGAGLLIPIMQTLLFGTASGRPTGNTMALVSLPALLGPVLGPVIGGLIVNHLDWRWIFYVNPPICLLAIVLAIRYLPRDTGRPGARLDITGLLLLSPGLAALIYGLSELGDRGGFGHPIVLVPLAGGALLVVAFVAYALRAANPLVDLRLFRIGSFSAVGSLMFLSGLASFGALLLLPLYYQQLRGESVLTAGLLMAPQGIGIGLSRLAGGLLDRWGIRVVVLVSTLLLIVGTLPFAFAGLHTSQWMLALALVLRGAGLGAILMAVLFGAYDGLPRELIPHASTATRILQQLGGSFGTALLAVALQRGLSTHPADPATAFDHAFWWALALTLPALAAVAFLPRRNAAAPAADEPSMTDAAA